MNKSNIGMYGLVVAVLIAFGAFTFVSGEQYALADPWSWGGSPSQGWLNCYNSGSSDCTNAR